VINDLYEKDSTFRLKVFGEGSWWIVSLKDPAANEMKPDCVVNHPRKRIGFRTKKGLEVKKYSNLDELVWDIREEGKNYDINFSKYKVVKTTADEGRRVVKGGDIAKRIKVKEENVDKIMRIICDSNNLDYPYQVIGFIYKNKFNLDSVLRDPIPLVSVLNEDGNFRTLKNIITAHYTGLKEFDYRNRGYQYFTGSSSKPEADGFLVPLRWFDFIQYCA